MEQEHMSGIDALVIGAGLAGCTAARRLAEAGRRVLVIEREAWPGGLAADGPDGEGVVIHRFGPHVFHTDREEVWAFLSRFTRWREYRHRVVANVDGQLVPIPFNLTGLEIAREDRAAALEEKLKEAWPGRAEVTLADLWEQGDADLADLGEYVYEQLYRPFTEKKWGEAPQDIRRRGGQMPIRLSREEDFYTEERQGVPEEGYAALFARMLDHPNLTLRLGVDGSDVLTLTQVGTMLVDGAAFHGPVVYTGGLDGLFAFRYGRLPYRVVDFTREHHPVEWCQTHPTVLGTGEEDPARTTEFKHLTGQEIPKKTTLCKEWSRPDDGTGIPCYPIRTEESLALYGRYAALAGEYPQLHLLGRLAMFRDEEMDETAARAMELTSRIING